MAVSIARITERYEGVLTVCPIRLISECKKRFKSQKHYQNEKDGMQKNAATTFLLFAGPLAPLAGATGTGCAIGLAACKIKP